MLFFRKIPVRAWIALFFAALLLTGLVTVGSYGRAWDEPSEMRILRMALKEYDALLPFDTPYSGYLQALEYPRISESVERDHGICMYYPLFWAFASDHLDTVQLAQIWRSHTWCIFVVGLWALYAICRRMGCSRVLSCAAVLMLFLSPRFFAEAHYNNKDISLMTLVLVLLWQTARMMEKPTWKRGLAFAFAAGLCAATRVVGVAFCGLFGLVLVGHLWRTDRLCLRTIGTGVFVLLASILFYLLLTPSFLADPPGFVSYVLKNAVGFSRWHGNILFFGKVIACASEWPPRTYLPAFIAVTTPIWALVLLLAGSAHLAIRCWQKRRILLDDACLALRCTALVSWIVPLLGLIALRSLVYNGWRHVYFLYGPMVLCMTCGLQAMLEHFKDRRIFRRMLCCIMCLCLLASAVGIAVNHPYQYAYYNALVPAQGRSSQFEMDWWNLSCLDALRTLLDATEGPVVIGASDRYTRSGLSQASTLVDTQRVTVIHETDSTVPQYVMANTGYAAIAGFEPSENMTPVVTIQSYGAPVNIIYRLEGSDMP